MKYENLKTNMKQLIKPILGLGLAAYLAVTPANAESIKKIQLDDECNVTYTEKNLNILKYECNDGFVFKNLDGDNTVDEFCIDNKCLQRGVMPKGFETLNKQMKDDYMAIQEMVFTTYDQAIPKLQGDILTKNVRDSLDFLTDSLIGDRSYERINPDDFGNYGR